MICDVQLIDNEEKDGISLKVKNGPKALFKDLVDTHQRVIAFIDILGFKSIIDEYESNIASSSLRRLKKCFDDSIKIGLKILLNVLKDDIEEMLDYKLFSDCMIISLPYIEFEHDFKLQFYNLSLIINTIQQVFMLEGFYLRGHITTGTYYADEHMIFSGGLVEAYINEGKTKYPIISINSKVCDRLRIETKYDNSLPSMEKLLVEHYLDKTGHSVFLNPYFTIEAYNKADEELSRIFKDVFGEHLGLPQISIKKIVNNEFIKQGRKDIDSEIIEEKDKIRTALENHYDDQIEIYHDLTYSYSKRNLASQILEKYRFLHALIKWIEDGDNEFFKYIDLKTTMHNKVP